MPIKADNYMEKFKKTIAMVLIIVVSFTSLLGCESVDDHIKERLSENNKLSEEVDSKEELIEQTDYFYFSIGGFGKYNTYRISKRNLVLKIKLEETPLFPVTGYTVWSANKWNSFIEEIIDCNVYDLQEEYVEPDTDDGTQWSLIIS